MEFYARILELQFARLEMDILYSIKEAAERLGGVSVWTIHSWLSQKRLLRTKVGSRTMIRESELERFLRACNQQPHVDPFRAAGTSPPTDSVEPTNLATRPTRGGAQ